MGLSSGSTSPSQNPLSAPSAPLYSSGALPLAHRERAAPRRRAKSRRWPSRALAALTWGLTFHVMVVAVLFAIVRLPVEVVRTVAAWKEGLMIVLIVVAATAAFAGRGPALRPRAVDVAALTVVALTLLHALAGLLDAHARELDLEALTYGMRDLALVFGVYALGRLTPEIVDDERALGRFMAVGVLMSAIAVVEWIVVTPDMLVLLGIASYFNDFLGATQMTVGNQFGLPDNYWTMIGGRLVQRAGSLQMSSQGLAIPYLLLVPAATMWMTLHRRWSSIGFLTLYAVMWLGLLLSVTRMTIAACALQVVVLVILARRPAMLVGLGIAGTATAVALLIAVPGLAGFVWETATWQTASSASHGKDYVKGLAALWAQPFGAGIATTDATAMRLGYEALTADNLFLKYGVELGVLGLLAFGFFLGALVWTGLRAAALSSLSIRDRAFAGVLAAMAIGVIFNGATAVPFNSPLLAYPFFWIAGAVVTVVSVNRADDARSSRK